MELCTSINILETLKQGNDDGVVIISGNITERQAIDGSRSTLSPVKQLKLYSVGSGETLREF